MVGKRKGFFIFFIFPLFCFYILKLSNLGFDFTSFLKRD